MGEGRSEVAGHEENEGQALVVRRKGSYLSARDDVNRAGMSHTRIAVREA